MKRPAIQFYVGDWFKDPELSMCSPATRGIWIDILCRMHDSATPGTLAGTIEQLARLTRCNDAEFDAAVRELDATKTARVTVRDKIVTLVNRRMEREERERKANAERQKRHRQKTGTVPNAKSNKKLTRLSSSSTSVVVSKDTTKRSEEEVSASQVNEIQTAWNWLGDPFPHTRQMTPKRVAAARARLSDRWWRENWHAGLGRLKASPFCSGGGPRGWVADLDWFLRPNTLVQIMEGKYDPRPSGPRNGAGLVHESDAVETWRSADAGADGEHETIPRGR